MQRKALIRHGPCVCYSDFTDGICHFVCIAMWRAQLALLENGICSLKIGTKEFDKAPQCRLSNIRIYHEFVDRIDNYVPRVTIWHHEVLLST